MRAATRDHAWAPGLPPTGQTCVTPRDSILPPTYLLVRLDQRFAIDPCPPSLRHLALQRVTWLEPRTPHQPDKLQKLSKNEGVCTPFVFRVNKKWRVLSAGKSIECRPSTAGCNLFGAGREETVGIFSVEAAFFPDFFRLCLWMGVIPNFLIVKIPAETLLEARFAVFHRPVCFAFSAHFAVKSLDRKDRKGREDHAIG